MDKLTYPATDVVVRVTDPVTIGGYEFQPGDLLTCVQPKYSLPPEQELQRITLTLLAEYIMQNMVITQEMLPDDCVGQEQLAVASVCQDHLVDRCVGEDEIQFGAVGIEHISRQLREHIKLMASEAAYVVVTNALEKKTAPTEPTLEMHKSVESTLTLKMPNKKLVYKKLNRLFWFLVIIALTVYLLFPYFKYIPQLLKFL